MLHEILLSLWGCSTNLDRIIENEGADFDKYLHPGEKALMKKILQTVNEFHNITDFIKKHISPKEEHTRKSNSTNENAALNGLYLRALCDGMDQSLNAFREDIVDLENIVLHDAYTPLTLVLCRVEKYVSLFSVLNSIIREIEFFNLRGCMLLECLYQYKHSGIPEVKAAIEKINHCVHAVFYKHLTSWLLNGHLEDVHREFFIQHAVAHNDTASTENSEISQKVIGKRIKQDMWDFHVQTDMVPSYVVPSLASKILTIGQTVIMFGNDPRGMKNDFSMKSNIQNCIWGEREYEYFQKLQNLQSRASFDPIELERTVDELKNCVTELLWRVAVEEAQLFQQLRLIKDFYLVGRGDLYFEFIKLTSHILNKTPTSHSSRDVNLAFQMAMRKMHLNEEAAADSFVFSVPIIEKRAPEDSDLAGNSQQTRDSVSTESKSSDKQQDPIEQRGWDLIVLNYKIVWPLQLLFSPSALNDYNVLFRFLLRVKKTQIDLSSLWTEQMRLKNVEIGVTQLRNNLIFIIDNLQYYLQVDVLESQYAIMESSINNTRNFEDVQKAHSIFLANVMSQTFLSGKKTERKNSVNKLIHLLLRLCDDFILQASIWEITNLLASEKKELKILTDTLDGLMVWLIKTLNAVRAQPSGKHLAQLLLRLDFNRWFSSKV